MKRRAATCRTRQQRRESAEALAEARSKLSYEDQITVLDQRLGVDAGAKRERSRLLAKIEERENKIKNTKKKTSGRPSGQKAKDRRRIERVKKRHVGKDNE